MASSESRVEIGYLEKSEPSKLESHFFPSKVGGKPAWLDLKNISLDVSCGVCRKPCIFLCQLYAPIDGEESAYHRTIYVFICRDPACCVVNKNDNFKVFRCQLGEKNDFYTADTSLGEPGSVSVNGSATSTCFVCGCLSNYSCGKCKTVRYCSKEHQILDWKSGHNAVCGLSRETLTSNALFPEFEILTEPEDFEDDDKNKEPEKTDEEKLKEFDELAKQGKSGTLADLPNSILEQFAVKEDKYFRNFKSRLSLCPDQVVRYEKGGQPLWVSTPNLKEKDIPHCEICEAPREFEFQILSTLLNHLNVDSVEKSIDWGTLLVYTCKNNCTGGPAYKREFLWKQDFL